MSLNAARLATALTPGIQAAYVASGATAPGSLAIATAIANAVAAAVIAEITANGSVAVPGTGLVAPVGGGPVTGAAVGSIS